jgi:hypothetical protein
MSPEEQLVFESRNRIRQTTVAVVGGTLLMIATIIGLLGPHAAVSEQTINLIVEHKRGTIDLLAAILNAFAELTIGATLIYLWRCARARSERAMLLLPLCVVIGVVLASVTGIVYTLEITSRSNTFVATGMQTYDEANRLGTSVLLTAMQIAGQLASLLIAIAFVLISLLAMRVGLLPRMMGYVGMLCGALFLFPITVVPVVQLFWFLALALLFFGRWPDGVPPAWRSGRAEAWPSGAETRARRAAAAEATRDRRAARKRGDHRAAVSDAPPPESDATGGEAARAPAAPKRKRKRRR